jgi:hypothetical protein
MSARQPNWFEDAENDLRGGGSRTILGRGLGLMQGRGDKGFAGLESGVSPETADQMGSPVLGPLRMVKGFAEAGQGHPLTGTKDMFGGTLQAAQIPAMVMAGPEAEALDTMIPSRSRAGAILGDIANAAKDVPVVPRNTMPALQRWEELTAAGGKAAKPMTKLSNRMTDMMSPATKGVQDQFLFPEGRDFYSNVSDLTRQKPLQTLMGRGLKPTMLRQAGNVRSALNSDLTDAASSIGQGDRYTDALREYARASKLRGGLLLGGAAVGEEALRRTGIFGHATHAVMGQ